MSEASMLEMAELMYDTPYRFPADDFLSKLKKLDDRDRNSLRILTINLGLMKHIDENEFTRTIQNQTTEIIDALMTTFDRASIEILTPEGTHFVILKIPLIHQLNHSCLPNAERYWNESKLELRALTKIEPSQEIVISYIDNVEARGERHRLLEFECGCLACTYDECELNVHERSCIFTTSRSRSYDSFMNHIFMETSWT